MKQLVKITQFFFVFFVILSCQKKTDESSNDVKKDSVVETQSASNDEPNTEFYKELSLQGITFIVKANGNQLTVQLSGLEISNETISKTIEGYVTGAEIEDLNSDGSPDLFIYTSDGENKFGNVIAFSVNNKKSVSDVNYPKTSENKEINNGYNGQDQFTVVENTLARRFPIFNTDGKPSGKTRQIEYNLVEGEASRQLIVNNVSEY
ncbi:hypothetical protein GFJ94_08115 [Flavobacterium sp. LMO8]|uniref:hypothetical protein n=1 Tax=Flavobacterium sp. LMO8 TaxID=2654244 RepID=UPI001292AD13|nr:hypothetical protein [Flavobacterium sp. LMO8]MQP25027.1 hypothetical protein [Flavobacterium sp. LMO8]